MAFQIDLAWGGYPGITGFEARRDRQRLRIISENDKAPYNFPSDRYNQKESTWYNYDNKNRKLKCRRSVSREEDRDDLRLFLQDKQKEKNVENSNHKSLKVQREHYKKNKQNVYFGDYNYKSEQQDHKGHPNDNCHKDKERPGYIYHSETEDSVERKNERRIKTRTSEERTKYPKKLKYADNDKIGSPRNVKRDKKHSYEEEVAKKERELQLQEAWKQSNEGLTKEFNEKSKSNDECEKISATRSAYDNDPSLRMLTKTERTYTILRDMREKDSTIGCDGNLIDSYRQCKKEIKELLERISDAEKYSEELNRKLDKSKQKVRKLKRNIAKEQEQNENYNLTIEQLKIQNKGLQVEANVQNAWHQVTKKTKKSNHLSNNKANCEQKLNEHTLKDENASTLVAQQPEIHTPIKLGDSAYVEGFISGVVPIAFSTPAECKTTLEHDLSVDTNAQNITEDKIHNYGRIRPFNAPKLSNEGRDNEQYVVTVNPPSKTIDKEKNKDNTKHSNAELMYIFRSEMQAAEKLWETEIKWEAPNNDDDGKQKKIDSTNIPKVSSEKDNVNEESIEPAKEPQIFHKPVDKFGACENTKPDSKKKEMIKHVRRTNEFKILNALKANDPIIKAIRK